MADATMHDGKTYDTCCRAAGTVFGAALLLALAACGPDTSQADLCERVVDKLYGGPGVVAVVKTDVIDGTQPRIAVHFRPTEDKDVAPRTVTCTFAGSEDAARLDLVGVRRPDNRPLHLVSVIFLKRQLSLDKAR